MYDFQHCFVCRPSHGTVWEDAGFEPRTVATTALPVRRSHHSARSHLLRLDLIHKRLDLIHSIIVDNFCPVSFFLFCSLLSIIFPSDLLFYIYSIALFSSSRSKSAGSWSFMPSYLLISKPTSQNPNVLKSLIFIINA
jgi:hypothetical protein